MVKIHGFLDTLQLLMSPEYKEVTKTSVYKICTFQDKMRESFIPMLLC